MRALRTGLSALAALAFAVASAADEAPAGPSLGLTLPGDDAAQAIDAAATLPSLDLLVTADWAAIERDDGSFDWSAIDPAIDAAAEKGARITLRLLDESGRHPRAAGASDVPDAGWLAAWIAFARDAAARHAGKIAVLELGHRPDRGFTPAAYAFVLKSAALAARAEARARNATLEIAQGAVGADAIDWQAHLWAADSAPYVDVLPLESTPSIETAAAVARFRDEGALHPPAARMRVDGPAPDGDDPFASLAACVRALAAGAQQASVALPADAAARPAVARVTVEIAKRLRDGYAPAPAGTLVLKTPDGSDAAGDAVWGRFLRARDFATLVVYDAKPGGDGEPQARLVLDTVDVKEPAVVDLATGAEYKTGPAEVPGASHRALRVLRSAAPMAIVWQRASRADAGLEAAPEDIAVRTTRGLTAEEIIAHDQEVQKLQDDRLLRWAARGHVQFHFKLAQGGSSFDIGIESRYFGRKGMDLEWEQLDYTVNGNKVGWKHIPELPLVQPEKVVTLPLDLTFDKTYAYRLVGEDEVGGRKAYVVAFEPTQTVAGKSLYQGRVWIDRESFVRLKVSVVQTNLEAPVISNDETDTYAPVTGPDGVAYWMLDRVDGQQLWTVAGRNFVVRREIDFDQYEVNPDEDAFGKELAAAYASSHQMLRDTDHGFRYLERQTDGTRTVKENLDTNQLFAAAGALKDNAIDSVVPLAGVDWFDYDLFHKNIQFNVFFAGVYAYANLTDPSLAGTKVDLGVESSLVALKFDEKLFLAGTEDVAQRIRRRSQYLTGRFGYPLGSFAKLALIADLSWNRYDDSTEGQEALAAQNAANGTSLAFALPANHQVYAGTAQLEFNRRGYSVTASGTYSHRTSWEPWGLNDTTTGQFIGVPFDPDQQNFTTWGVSAFKEWYLPKFQKLRFELDYLDGSNLDRFSQYQFSTFGGESLAGFSGAGVRFDIGGIARFGWAFNLANAIRFDVDLEHARVQDRYDAQPYQNHTGVGLSFNVVGPWTTIWQASYGRALWSDVSPLEGQQEFRVVVLKLF